MLPSIVGRDETIRLTSDLAYKYALWTRSPATSEVVDELRVLQNIAKRGIPTLEEALGCDGELRAALEGIEGCQQAFKRMMSDAKYFAHMKDLYEMVTTHFH